MQNAHTDLPGPPPISPYALVNEALGPNGDVENCADEFRASKQVCIPQCGKQPEPFSLSTSARMNARHKTVLVVEDDESLLKEFAKVLIQEKYLLRSARCPNEGQRLYADCGPFFAVIIDYRQPNLAEAIRQQDPMQRMVMVNLGSTGLRSGTLMDVPVLTELADLPKILDELRYWATKDEVAQACQALRREELLKLQEFADSLVSRIRWAAGARDGSDLLQEALLSTFRWSKGEKGRRWDKENGDFATHLANAMRSTARNWLRQEKLERQICRPVEIFTSDNDGREHSLLDDLEGDEEISDGRLIAREEIQRIFKMFEDDEKATKVLEGWKEDMTQSEIMQKFYLTDQELKAAVKRIRILVRRKRGL